VTANVTAKRMRCRATRGDVERHSGHGRWAILRPERSGATGSGTLPRFAKPLTGISWSVDSNPTPSATKPQRLPLFRAFDALRMSVHRVVFSVSSLSDGKADGKTCAEDPLYIARS
jgi:hypothetical protein